MPRYIDATALRKEFSERPPDYYTTGYILDTIDEQPTVSPDEVRGVIVPDPFEGVWLPVPDKIGDCLYKCSQCGFVRDAYVLGIENYCPNCGAKMEVTSDGVL